MTKEERELIGFAVSGEYSKDCKCKSCKALPDAIKSMLAEVDKQGGLVLSNIAQQREIDRLKKEIEWGSKRITHLQAIIAKEKKDENS